MQHRPAGIGRRGRRPIELALQPADQLARRWRRSGRRAGCGGMVPACSRRTTFSQVSAESAMRPRSRLSSVIWPGGSLARWLWHVTQYRSSTSRYGATAAGTGGAAGLACGRSVNDGPSCGNHPNRDDGDDNLAFHSYTYCVYFRRDSQICQRVTALSALDTSKSPLPNRAPHASALMSGDSFAAVCALLLISPDGLSACARLVAAGVDRDDAASRSTRTSRPSCSSIAPPVTAPPTPMPASLPTINGASPERRSA